MALPSSGVIYLSQIKSYFGETTPPQYLTSYNRGGTYVQNIPANTNIPTSASPVDPIYITDFRGSSDPEVQTLTAGSGSLTVPTYQTNVTVEVWGGGGGGAGIRTIARPGCPPSESPGGAGGGGGYAYNLFSVSAGAPYAYTVGDGGIRGAAQQAGQNGGSSSFGPPSNTTQMLAVGGTRGGVAVGGAGGTTSGGLTPRSESGQAGTLGGGGGGDAGGLPYGGGLGGKAQSPGQVAGGGGSGGCDVDSVPGFPGARGQITLTWS